MSRRNGRCRYRYRYFVFYVLVGLIYPPSRFSLTHTYIQTLSISLFKTKTKSLAILMDAGMFIYESVFLFLSRGSFIHMISLILILILDVRLLCYHYLLKT